jgi:ferredoxin-thioredoxin reductase catalytic subunit
MKEAGCVELEFIFTLLSQIAAVALPRRCKGRVGGDTVREDEAVAMPGVACTYPEMRDAGRCICPMFC